MAHATKTEARKRLVIMQEVELEPALEETFHLTLSKDEAETLLAVCTRIGGSPVTTRRAHTDRIAHALQLVGLHAPDFETGPQNRAIYFTEPF